MNTAAKYAKMIDCRNSPVELEKLVRSLKLEDLRTIIPKLEPEFRMQKPGVMDDVFQVLVKGADKETLVSAMMIMMQGIGDSVGPE